MQFSNLRPPDSSNNNSPQVSSADNTLSSLIRSKLKLDQESIEDASVPFKIIEFMARNFPKKFMDKALVNNRGELAKNMSQGEYSGTSCINNLHVLSIIFFGKEIAKVIMERFFLRYNPLLIASFKNLPNVEYNYRANYLFLGPAVQVLDKAIEDTAYSQQDKSAVLNKNFRTIIVPYYNQRSKIIEQCSNIARTTIEDQKNEVFRDRVFQAFEQSHVEVDYDFNRTTMDQLKKEIDINSKDVKPDSSFIYYSAIIAPDNTENRGVPFYHAFAIEQFFDKSSCSVRYRQYQTWIKEMDLAASLQKKNYTPDGGGSISHEEFKQFLEDLGLIVCKTTVDQAQIQKAHERCFGFQNDLPYPLNRFDEDGKKLEGVALLYIARKINPRDCLNNFVSFIESTPALRQEVERL